MSELKRRHIIEEERTQKKRQKKAQDEGDDMGVGGAAAEDAEAEYINHICETNMVTVGDEERPPPGKRCRGADEASVLTKAPTCADPPGQ